MSCLKKYELGRQDFVRRRCKYLSKYSDCSLNKDSEGRSESYEGQSRKRKR